MKLPYNFTVGNYKLRVDYTRDAWDKPTTEKWCWKWNGYLWELLFPVEQGDIDETSLVHFAAQALN